MKPAADERLTLRFGSFEVDLPAGELRRHGTRVRLQEQPFRVLARLLLSAGQVVTREELRAELWPADTFVDFDNGLNTAVNKIREALGDSAASPRYLETLPRRGYRFIFPVDTIRWPDVGTARTGARRIVIAATTVTAILVLALALVVFDIGGFRTHVLKTRSRAPSIAVLPLENLSGDSEQEYFADGMTEALISQLARAGGMHVISRTSVLRFKRTRRTIREIARELGVDAIVEGTVMRSGNRVRISVQLVDAATDRHRWAGTYEGDIRGVLSLQNQTALAIGEEIQIELSPEARRQLAASPKVDPEAHEAYLRGRYLVNQMTPASVSQAVRYYERAVKKAPDYAPAHASLAHAYFVLAQALAGTTDLKPRDALEKSKAAASRAVTLDPGLAEAHAVLGIVRWLYDWDWQGGEAEFMRAIRLNANSVEAHNYFAIFLHASGRYAAAMSELARARDLDPLNVRLRLLEAELLCYAGEYDEGMRAANNVLALDPNPPRVHLVLGWVNEHKGHPTEAVAEYLKYYSSMGLPPEEAAALREASEREGLSGFYRRLLPVATDESRRHHVRASVVAEIYAALGDRDGAFRCLEEAFAAHDSQLMFLNDTPGLRSLREDPRFSELLRRIGYPRPPE